MSTASISSCGAWNFVAAAKVADLSTAHIMLREILPSAIPPVIVQAAFDASVAILIEASLGFLGLSDPNMVSWGQILHVAQDYMTVAWWTSLFPGAAICLAVVGLNLFADGLNEIVDPRLRGRWGAPVMSAASVEGAPLLSVRNLKVHLRVGETVVRAVDGLDFRSEKARASVSLASPDRAKARSRAPYSSCFPMSSLLLSKARSIFAA